MATRKELIEELLGDLQAVRRSLGPATAHKSAVTGSQLTVLALIAQQKNMTIKELAASLGVTSSAATQLADALVKSGYLIRSASREDRRAVHLAVSKKTTQKIAQLRKAHLSRLLPLFDVLSDTEFKTYVALNKKIAQGALTSKTTILN